MRESSTYRMIIKEGEVQGRLKEALHYTLLLGKKRYGNPGADVLVQLRGIGCYHKLREIGVRMLDASSWEEALEGP